MVEVVPVRLYRGATAFECYKGVTAVVGCRCVIWFEAEGYVGPWPNVSASSYVNVVRGKSVVEPAVVKDDLIIP